MWRKIACAAGGLALAGAAAYGLSATPGAGGLDLSFLYMQQQRSTVKSDRLSMPVVEPASGFAISFNLPAQNTTVVAKNPPMQPIVQSAVRIPRDPIPVQSVKQKQRPDEMARKPKLPEGCEPSFSPVTVPSLAHIAGRCTS